MKKVISLLVIGCFIFANIAVFSTVGLKIKSEDNKIKSIIGFDDYVTHEPIVINGNDEFTPSNGVTGGSGSEYNPYIIEGWEIVCFLKSGIVIKDTSAHFIIRNCWIKYADEDEYAIKMDDAKNGEISNCLFTQNERNILIGPFGENFKIKDNFFNFVDDGTQYRAEQYIQLAGISNVLIDNNKFYNASNAFWLMSNHVTISNNEFYNVNNAIEIRDFMWDYDYGHNNVINNVFIYPSDETHASRCIFCSQEYNSITNNIIIGPYEEGILISWKNHIISNNIIEGCKEQSISISSSCENSRIVYNTMKNNQKYALAMWTSIEGKYPKNNILHHNNFLDPNTRVIVKKDNVWDDGAEGNYWIDYNGEDNNGDGVGDTPYNISDTIQDMFPLMEQIEEFQNTPPNKPTITGPANGRVDWSYDYTILGTDSEGHKLRYNIVWGDGSQKDTGYAPSGDIISREHVFSKTGVYNIRVRAQDEYGLISEWSDPLSVSMPRNKEFQGLAFSLLNNYPIIYQLLQQLFNL